MLKNQFYSIKEKKMTKVIALQKSFPDMLSLTDLEMAITRPYDDARVDDAGDWEEICSNVREFSKLYLDHDYDDNSILSRRILLNGLDDNNRIIVDDGSVWRKNSAISYKIRLISNDKAEYPNGDIRKYIFRYGDIIKENDENSLTFVGSNYRLYSTKDKEDYELLEDKPWSFSNDELVYVFEA